MERLAELIGLNPWTVQAFLIILAALLLDFVMRKFVSRIAALADRSSNFWDNALVYAGKRPISLLIYGQDGMRVALKVRPRRKSSSA